MYYSYWTIVFPAFTVFCLLSFFMYYRKVSRPLAGTTEWISRVVNRPAFADGMHRYSMSRNDVLPVTIITLVCAFFSFYKLGDTTAPQSFHQFTGEKKSVVITLDEPEQITSLMYYTGLWEGHYTLEFSADGSTWLEQHPSGSHTFAMDQPYSDLFKWMYADLNGDAGPTKYIRLTASQAPLELGEVALYGANGQRISTSRISCPDAPELFDEQRVVPSSPGYMNSMYFDEIYHGRTAFENIRGIYPYENSHPPLGKLIIAIGIKLFGMTPFGWRFMGTLFGILMLPIFYVFLKNLFGKTVIASCGTLLFAFDFMHFVQTRIATIDTYGVMFILISYFFMYRYLTQDFEQPFRKTLIPLGLSGLFFGIGAASKWTVLYSGAGLAAFYIIRQVMRYRYDRKNEIEGFGGYLVKTILVSIPFFIIIPAVIYCLSYITYGLPSGMTVWGGMLWDPKFYKIIWDNQVFMFTYHTTLKATHPYSSTWWEWIIDYRPILYFSDSSMGHGLKSAFAAFGNPVVWWGGFMAMIAMTYRVFKYRDWTALFILIGYLSQMLPWLAVTRILFIYHYFPSTLFLVMALAHVLNTVWERRQGRYELAVYGFTGSAILLFVLFYPVLTGIAVPETYTNYILRWIPAMWPF